MKIYSFCIFIISIVSVQAWYTTIVVSGTTIVKTLPRSTFTSTNNATSTTFITSSSSVIPTTTTTTPITTITTTTTTSSTTTTASASVTPSPTTGCSEMNFVINFYRIIHKFNQFHIITPTSCLSSCPSNTMYYSLSTLDMGTYGCFCYNSNYVFIPITTADNNCTVIGGYNYGISNSGYYDPPGTEYIYAV
jgi:hypothetical protein